MREMVLAYQQKDAEDALRESKQKKKAFSQSFISELVRMGVLLGVAPLALFGRNILAV